MLDRVDRVDRIGRHASSNDVDGGGTCTYRTPGDSVTLPIDRQTVALLGIIKYLEEE